jgi:transcription elongation factor GreB
MSRYRPPREKSTPYVTPEGQRVLAEELKFLWKQKRPEVTAKVAEAAAMGDRSENAEYIYGKKQLREIDARIRYLSKRLDELVVVDRTPGDTDLIYFGAWVKVCDDQGDTHQYRIVGADEFDREACYISVDAPVARALLRKRVGDAVEVVGPDGTRALEVLSIRYGKPCGEPSSES